jgi:hypothetical protein
MALSVKTRYAILGLVLAISLGSFLFNQAAIALEIPGLDLNKKDVYFFEKDYAARYKFENGTKNVATTLTLSSHLINETCTNVTIQHDGSVQWFLAHPNGTVYQGNELQGNYSIWWIYIPNELMLLGINAGESFNVIDPTGFLGIVGRAYTLTVEKKLTYWPSEPELMALSGAQASLACNLWDKATNELVSRIIFDVTCGIIETWEGSQSKFIRLTMTETTFPISRNRFVILPCAIVLGICIGVFIALLLKYHKKAKSIEAKQREEILSLYVIGAAAMLIEIIDIWFYLYPGVVGMFLIHIFFTVGAGIACWRQNYGYKWLLPSILEIAFVFALSGFTGDPIVPSITAFMGSTITWLCLIWASGYEKHVDDGERGLLKFLSSIS